MEARLTAIPREEALRYLGVRGPADPALRADLDRCASLLESTVRPRMTWRLFSLQPDGTLSGTSFRPEGEDIRNHLRGCREVILFAATLGAETESLIRRTQPQSMADAVILDALAGAAVENVCDNACADLAALFAPRGLTSRYSPGYGDFPLAQQRELFAVLNVSRLLGITLTPGGLMIPQKSVTALIGVSDAPPEENPGRTGDRCRSCSLSDSCPYRKEGTACGKF